MEKVLETAWVIHKLDGAGSQGIIRAGQQCDSVSQADGESDPWGRTQKRNSGFCQHFFPGESCPSSPHPDAQQFSSSLYVPGTF